jgi:NTP pyrophosphatase (non-canonical NTP hydrolase)|tara:strand:- start:70 stop:345 length:276 start_codon:yes stop_codon:yes gene_type:complete
MDDKVKEILLITQEECAEVTQAISKVFRFGLNERWPEPIDPTNKERLEEEAGDLLCMIDIMVENGIISDEKLNKAKNNKRQKLKTWSSIFK